MLKGLGRRVKSYRLRERGFGMNHSVLTMGR